MRLLFSSFLLDFIIVGMCWFGTPRWLGIFKVLETCVEGDVSLPVSISSTWGTSQNSWYPQPLVVPIEVLNMDIETWIISAVLTLPRLPWHDSFSPWLPTYFEFSKFKTITKFINKLHFWKTCIVMCLFCVCVCVCSCSVLNNSNRNNLQQDIQQKVT